ncbi:MAG: hypothetical protein MJZ34_13930 [Paludibacteraceae bacterium]|nr:hypothetical protein [Paludibacteraceae bacterium]
METYTDERDGETYKIVQIGNLYWFSENLRHQGVGHYFPNRNSDNVEKYGCLYTWENAMKACLEGWRLPTKDEFEQLLTITRAKDNTSSIRDRSWNKGTNYSGFGALPAGIKNSIDYLRSDIGTCFWSATLTDSKYAYRISVGSDYANIGEGNVSLNFSVRYVKEV